MPRRARSTASALSAAVCVLALAGVAGCSGSDGARTALSGFLRNWQGGTLDKASYLGASGADVAAAYRAVAGDLAEVRPKLAAGEVRTTDNRATAPVEVTWPVGTGRTWRYRTQVSLVKQDDRWLVDWSAATVHPRLSAGRRLTIERDQAERAPISDGAGRPIVVRRPVVYVGVEPRQVTDPAKLARDLQAALGVNLADLPARLKQARPDAFVDVITLRKEQYDQVKPQIYGLDGTVFRTGTLPLSPSRTFARALLGSVGPVTKELTDAAPGRYDIGDLVGLSGLQRRYDDQLIGKPGVTVLLSAEGAEPVTLYRAEPVPGAPVRTTLDQRVQQAADLALGPETRSAALVAIRISTGAVVAAANGPDGGNTNLAFEASVPPGSTFKVVSTIALLGKGLHPDDPVDCPRYATVSGRRFHNAEDFALGSVPFRTDFAESCNTAFVGLSSRLDADDLTGTASQLGIGVPWRLGVEVNSGSVPAAPAAVDRAASTFGQGRTTVSPIAMAAAAAAVSRGQWTQPKLLLDPAVAPAPSQPRLAADRLAALRALMRAVVTDGTGKLLAGVPGGPVYGKTGTAEYGSADPPATHAWFMGWQGDLAFAAFVQDGGEGADAAAPAVARFLRTLAG